MIKKVFIYASVAGLATGVIYWLSKKEKTNQSVSAPVDNKVDLAPRHYEEELSQNSTVMDEMYQAKSESVQAVFERHSEASEIMKDSYRNIMENFVEDFSDVKVVNDKDESKPIIIDSESVSVMKKIDLISDELDDLLK